MTDSVINFVEKRNEAIEQRRREFERILFKNFLGVYSVLDEPGTGDAVDLIDISDKGCLIQIHAENDNKKRFKKDSEAHLRIYFTRSAYIPVTVIIKYNTDFIDIDGNSYLRYGCEFDKTCGSFEAMDSFIKFLYKFAEHSCADRGDLRQSMG